VRAVKRVYTFIQGAVIVLAGIYGLFVALGQYLNWQVAFLPNKDQLLEVILGVVAILVLEVGLGQVIHFNGQDERLDKQDQRLDDIETLLKRSLGGSYLKSSAEVYAAGTRLTANMERKLRTIVYGRGAKGTRQWAEAAARRLRHLKDMGGSPEFHVVIAVDLQNVPASFQGEIDQRLDMFVRQKVGDRVSLHLLDVKPVIGNDVYIIDKAHVFINPVPFPDVDTQRAIVFENQPVVAEDYAEWFDNSILPKTMPYSVWRNQQTPATP